MPEARITSLLSSSGLCRRLPLVFLLATTFLQSEPIAILRLRVLGGEGQVHGAGARSPRPVAVLVTDETGRPVEGATVSFRLPEDGPTGSFTGGMRTDIAVTAKDGKAESGTIEWGKLSGPVSIRVTALKDQVRAGMVVPAYLSEDAPAPSRTAASPAGRGRWVKLGLIVGGAAAGGLAYGWSRGRTSGTSEGPAGVTQPPVIGTPDISIGRPQ